VANSAVNCARAGCPSYNLKYYVVVVVVMVVVVVAAALFPSAKIQNLA